MNRRQFLTTIPALCAAPYFIRSQATSPNFVFILADDLGRAELSAYNPASPIATPNIDRLAAEGMTFDNAYSPSPVCTPMRWCLHTGQHMGWAPNLWWPFLQPGTPGLLPEQIRAAGYECGCFGKWGLGQSVLPWDVGYDFVGSLHDDSNPQPDYVWRNGSQITLSGDFAPDVYLDHALDFLDSQHDNPFFLYFPSNVPHIHAGDYYTPGLNPYQEQPWPQVERNYAAAITYLDSQVGAILDQLDDLGIADNTCVVFASDNGPALARSEFWGTMGLRANKGHVYEGGICVPQIVRWPGVVVPGSTSHEITVLHDWYTTMTGALPVDGGVDLRPALAGGSLPERSLYFAWHRKHAQVPVEDEELHEALRTGQYKVVQKWNTTTGARSAELYDLATDPGETTNLAATDPDRVAMGLRLMARYCGAPKECRVWLPVVGE